jgi:hypothetical protein
LVIFLKARVTTAKDIANKAIVYHNMTNRKLNMNDKRRRSIGEMGFDLIF